MIFLVRASDVYRFGISVKIEGSGEIFNELQYIWICQYNSFPMVQYPEGTDIMLFMDQKSFSIPLKTIPMGYRKYIATKVNSQQQPT